MNTYILAIRESFSYFPLIAALLTIPYIIHNYHKYGSIFSLRILIVYSFVLYIMTAYFLVIMPLPTYEEVLAMTGDRCQLIPFSFVADIIKERLKTGVHLYRNKALWQFVFNMIMLMPFGMYLHYYFDLDLKKTIRYSFMLSLFFELTQLSGLYFTYPRPYRLFDVDDLMANTLGGAIGFFLAMPLMNFLPNREELDHLSLKRGHKVSGLRRLTAFGIDMAIFLTIMTIASFFSDWLQKNVLHIDLELLFCFCLSVFIFKGKTPGLHYLKLRLVSTGKRTQRLQFALRYIINYLIMFRLPTAAIFICSSYVGELASKRVKMFVLAGGAILYGLFLLMEFILILLNKDIFADRLSHTTIESEI